MKYLFKTTKLFLAAITLLFISQTAFSQSKTSSSAFEIKNEALKEYVGQYNPESTFGAFNITISMTGDDKLMAQPTDKSNPNTLLVATKKDYFDLSGTPLKINFNRDQDGTIVSLSFSQGLEGFTAMKVKADK